MTVTDGLKLALPFAAADFVDGMAFGVIAAGVGVGALASTLVSATAFSGRAQFAALPVLGDRGSLAAVLLAVVALNARYLAFGAAVAPALSRGRLARAAEAQLLTDASWALSLRDGGPRRAILVGVGAAELVAWTTGTASGALLGGVLGDYRAIGLDAALPTFFLCLLVERLRGDGGASRAAAGAVLAVALTPLAPPGVPLLVVLAGALAWGRR